MNEFHVAHYLHINEPDTDELHTVKHDPQILFCT